MAFLLQVRNAHKRYGDQVLLDGAELTLMEDVKVGFVGRNGAGKSTLLRVLLGEEELDSGEVVFHPRLRLGYLKQHDPFLKGETGLEYLMRDSGQPDWKCGEVAGRFELKGAYLEGPISELSGGWQTRLKLAALLLHDPNLLLLDEPTNFLDLRTQILLEHFLRDFRQACLIVSHDRAFLGATCSETLDLSRGRLTMFPGKIDGFLEHQAARREQDERTNASVLAKRRHLEDFIARNKARASTASRAKSKSKQLEKLETIEVFGDEPSARIMPPLVEPRKGPAVRCNGVSIGYADRTVAKGIDVEIDHGQRAAIVGDNGQGKTTFLRTIVGSLEPLAGDVRWGYGCSVGTYAQHVYTSLPKDKTVMDYLEYVAAAGTKPQQILDLAGSMLFRGEATKKKVSVLSGGERARLCMAGLLLSQHNILVLDEPGNHLDVDTIEALAEALKKYQGTVIFTSHDRHFMKEVATCIVEVRDGHVTNYRGDYEAYLWSVNKEIEEGEREAAAARGKTKGHEAPKPAKAARKNDRDLRKEQQGVERQIAKLDEQRKELDQKLLSTTDPHEAMELHQQVTEIGEQIAPLEERWLELHEMLEGEA
ncbi:MAG: ABC-F family ATP-binding cassette domain-containing protein [Pirellulaceae bacterium]|nr:ABC-F family ATP-binding cassette domain-containing protein [Planctomycetales bacterium]